MEPETAIEEMDYGVAEDLMAVQATGRTNMFDRRGVIEVAEDLGLDDTAHWMRQKVNRPTYLAWLTGRGSDR